MWPGSHVIESRVGVRVRDDVKRQGFLMVYTWCAHVQWRLRVWRQGTCRKYGSLMENTCGWVIRHEDRAWTLGSVI